MPTNKPRFSMTMSEELLAKIDSFQESSGIHSRNKAIHALIRSGLADIRQSGKSQRSLGLSTDALELARDFDVLDEHGRDALRALANVELARLRDADSGTSLRVIPLLGASFAAGKAEPDFGNMWTDYEVESDSPAEFAIRVHGDSMEPALPDGSIALGVRREPRDGEVAAFMLNGEFLVKQFCQDSQGNIYLFSLNRSRSDLDVSLMRGADPVEDLYCFGTILLPRRYPLP